MARSANPRQPPMNRSVTPPADGAECGVNANPQYKVKNAIKPQEIKIIKQSKND